MKRFTIALALAMMIFAPAWAEKVTPETARKVATTFLNNNGAKTAQLTDLSKAAGFPNLYIFSTENSFVIMSADDCVKPVLGYSLTGDFDVEDMPDHVRSWLQRYSNEIQYAISSKMSATPETAQLWKALSEGKGNVAKANVEVSPLIQTKWNQNKYYNSLCPAANGGPEGHAYTGCVATAMAQIMKYWGHPAKGIGFHSYIWKGQTMYADFNSTTYDWDNMQQYYNYYFANGTDQNANWINPPTSEQLSAVATLMYHCGVSVDMNYGGGSSGAVTAFVANALKTYFHYSSDIAYKEKNSYDSNVWITMVKAELDANRPLEYCGSSDSSGGHAFVCDGYNDSDYFHFNWGWSGHYDGYFSLDNLDTGANNESGSGNGVFTDDQAAIFGIEPVQCSADDPTNLTYTLSGIQGLTLNWDPASNAASYNIYRNNNLVGNSTTTTYTETAPFGTNVYFVCSVDANGEMSLSSNYVTINVDYKTPNVEDLTATLSGNTVNLSWTSPEWCYPESPSAMLTYGDNNPVGGSTTKFWGHRFLPNVLAPYVNKALYKVSFYAYVPGRYNCLICKASIIDDDVYYPQTMITSKTIDVSNAGSWVDIILDDIVIIDGQDDIWVILNDSNNGSDNRYSAIFCDYSDTNNHGCYKGFISNGTLGLSQNSNLAWLIRTYLTDGIYTYNLYDNGVSVADDIVGTSYVISNPANNTAHQYTVKTNYYGGESSVFNMAGLTLGTASINGDLILGSNDKMTLAKNSKLTVNGTMSDDNPNNLILEDSAQLIHSSAGVKATVKKDITAYTSDQDGWNFIASPIIESIEPSEDNGILNGNYDLYFYEEPSNMWRNHKEHIVGGINQNTASDFRLNYKQGYLYANDTPTTLYFSGTLAPSNSAISSNTLSFNNKGFNFLGNPFICNAMIEGDFFVLNEPGNKVVLAEQNRQIAPCEGVFVQVSAAGQTVSFSKATTKGNHSTSLDLVVSQGRSTLDRTRVRLGEGANTEKFTLDGDQSARLSLWHDGQEYAVAFTNGLNELPLNFKAAENGTYTIGI